MDEPSTIDTRLSNLHQMVMTNAVNRLKRAGHRRIEQARDSVFGPLAPAEEEDVLVGGDLTINAPQSAPPAPPAPPARPGLLRALTPYVLTAALAGAGGWCLPLALQLYDTLRTPDSHEHVDTDTRIVPRLSWGPERPGN